MEEQWNKTVGPNDKVYHLGDIAMPSSKAKSLHILNRLNGEKVLIRGNHDQFDLKDYARYFKDVRGSHQFDGMLLTHIPVHEQSLGKWGFNVHGHLHARRVALVDHYIKGNSLRIKCQIFLCFSRTN